MAAFMKIGDIKGESVVAPDRADQDFVVEDNGDQVAQFTTGGGGDSITDAGLGNNLYIWTNGGASTLKVDAGGTMDFSKADGFMKLGDIRGEFSPSRNTFYGGTIFYLKDVSSGLRGQGSSGDTVTSGDGTDSISSNGESGFASWQDVRNHNHNHGNRTNWDVICDIGTSIKANKFADALTNYRPEGFSEVKIHFATENLDSRLINHDDFLLVNNIGGVPQGPGGTSHLTGYSEAISCEDGDVRGVGPGNDTNNMQPGIALRSDNRFVLEPVNLFEGLDAGNALDSRLINPDSFLLMNNVTGSADPGGNDI